MICSSAFILNQLNRARMVGKAGLMGGVLLLLTSASTIYAQDCTLLGGTVVGAECQISGTQTLTGGGTFNLSAPPQTLHILGNGRLVVPSVNGAPQTLTINIGQDLIMDVPTTSTGSQINGDASGSGMRVGATITINADGNILLQGNGTRGASITSDQAGGNCANSMGGNITLNADFDGDLSGDVTIQNGASVTANARCPAGAIVITGVTITNDGLVESASNQSGTGRPGGGPITLDAACDLITTGKVSSRGKDPGADRVHLEGGCRVEILGLVESAGNGHGVPNNPPNHCDNNAGMGGGDRPDKPANSTACVEVWAGDLLIIDRTAPNSGEVKADTGNGGASGTSWIDLFARGPITITGNSVAPFAVHANGNAGTNDEGGIVTVKSTTSTVTTTGLALQASASRTGGKGGQVTVEANLDVNLSNGTSEARGSLAGANPAGGNINVRSFNGAIVSDVNSLLDVTGGNPPSGAVNLTACGAIGFPPGTIAPAGATVNKNPGVCGGAPMLPAYVILPNCLCLQPGPGEISVTKTCVCADQGGGNFEVTITGEVCNTGTVDLVNVMISDNPPAVFTVSPPTMLAPGQCAPYEGSFMTNLDPSTDTVTVTAETQAGDPVQDSADATCSCTVDCPEDPHREPFIDCWVGDHGCVTNGPVYPTLQAALDSTTPVCHVIGICEDTIDNVCIGSHQNVPCTNQNWCQLGPRAVTITQCTRAEITAANNACPVVEILSTQPVLIIGPDTVGGTIGWDVASSNNELRGVRASGASVAGIAVLGNNNSVSWNSVRNGADRGVLVTGDFNDLRGGTVENNGGNGVEFTATASNNELRGASYIRNNGGNGIQVDGNVNTLKDNRRVEQNAGDGIIVNGTGNQIGGNAAQNNAGNEFDIGPGNVDKTGNKANGSACTFGAAGGVCN